MLLFLPLLLLLLFLLLFLLFSFPYPSLKRKKFPLSRESREKKTKCV
jgi:hypothetical protein